MGKMSEFYRIRNQPVTKEQYDEWEWMETWRCQEKKIKNDNNDENMESNNNGR